MIKANVSKRLMHAIIEKAVRLGLDSRTSRDDCGNSRVRIINDGKIEIDGLAGDFIIFEQDGDGWTLIAY